MFGVLGCYSDHQSDSCWMWGGGQTVMLKSVCYSLTFSCSPSAGYTQRIYISLSSLGSAVHTKILSLFFWMATAVGTWGLESFPSLGNL